MSAIPEGFNTVIPALVLKDAAKAIETYQNAFGAKVLHNLKCPETGKIMHACLEIGTSKIFLSDEMPGCMAASNSSFYLYMPDVDASFTQAKKAGMTEKFAPQDMFWGDRMGTVTDENGISWSIATHKRDVSPDEMDRGAKEMAARMKESAKAA